MATPHPLPEALMAAPDHVLESHLDLFDRREDQLNQRIDSAQRRLGGMAVRGGYRAETIQITSETIGERAVTDPHKPDPEIPRAPETFIGRHTLRRAMGRMATHFSVHPGAPNATAIRREVSRAPAGAPSRGDLRGASFTARRLARQQVRQDRAKHAEATFGAGLGLGSQALVRSKWHRHKLRKEIDEDYRNRTINPLQHWQEKQAVKGERVEVPVKAVRREVRRERLGAMYSWARADQPIRKRVRAARKKLTERSINRKQEDIARIQGRRTIVEGELARRHP